MKVHNVKLHENYVEQVLSGEKNFEVRNNDRGYQKGDLLRFTVVEGSLAIEALRQPFKGKDYEITYVHSGLGMDKGFVVLGIRPYKGEEA